MREEGFSETQISGAVELIKDCGGMETATESLDSMIDEIEAA